MHELYRKSIQIASSEEWRDVFESLPLRQLERVAIAALSDRDIKLRFLQGVMAAGEYTWLRQSGESAVAAGERGPGLMSQCGFPWGQLQILNESGQVAAVEVVACGVQR